MSEQEQPSALPGASVQDTSPVDSAPSVLFPKIARQVYDVLHDDDRHEVWIGIKLRTPAKGKLSKDGPVVDLEMSFDPLSIVMSLDAAKQEVIMALSKDNQMLNQELQRKAALQTNGVMGRLNAGLGDLFNKGKTLIRQ